MVLLIFYEVCENRHVSYGRKRHFIYMCTIKRYDTLPVEKALIKFVHYGTEYILQNFIILFILR